MGEGVEPVVMIFREGCRASPVLYMALTVETEEDLVDMGEQVEEAEERGEKDHLQEDREALERCSVLTE